MKEKQTELTPEIIEVYSDGACSPNPGFGGYGYLIRFLDPDTQEEMRFTGSAGYRRSTNNRMELMGALAGIIAVHEIFTVMKKHGLNIPFRTMSVTSDSSYLCNTFNKGWLVKWKRNNWIKSDKEPVSNVDIWQLLDEAVTTIEKVHGVHAKFIHVRGHIGYVFNEQCDKLAVAARKQKDNLQVDKNYETGVIT